MFTRNGLQWSYQRRWERIALIYYLRRVIHDFSSKYNLDILDIRIEFNPDKQIGWLNFNVPFDVSELESLPASIRPDSINDDGIIEE